MGVREDVKKTKGEAQAMSNVIEVQFGQVKTSQDMQEFNEHLNSLVDHDDDPLEQLLNAGSEQEDLLGDFDDIIKEDHLSYHKSLNEMADHLSEQLDKGKELIAKMSYYLDEMNL